MITRATLFSSRGGDTVQIEQTARQLAVIGVEVDVKLTNEIIDYQQYHLLHFFNLTRPADILYHINRTNKPFVVSPILIDYSEFDKYHRHGIAGIIFRYLSTNTIEYLKTLARWIRGSDRLVSLSFILNGQTRSIKKILHKASAILPNSESEFLRLVRKYDYTGIKMVVPNGINPALFQLDDKIKKDPHLVICVARIEGIKNQLNLIKALNNSHYHLLVIGAPAPNQLAYYKICKKIAATNVTFIDIIPQVELLTYYQQAKVHVLPSWFETTGLSSLEAAAMGCNIVITDRGDAKEYFREYAFYCDPSSPESIYEAIEKASKHNYPQQLVQLILGKYTWQQAAIQTNKAYEAVVLPPEH